MNLVLILKPKTDIKISYNSHISCNILKKAFYKLVAELVMGRVGYGPSLSWAEFVMGRDVQLPFHQAFIVIDKGGEKFSDSRIKFYRCDFLFCLLLLQRMHSELKIC